MHKRHQAFYSILALASFLFTSCVSTREATYFNDVKDTDAIASTTIPESHIQKNDILSITVSSLNPQASAVFNAPVGPSGQADVNGYLVNTDGNIQFPVLGNIKAAGLTKDALKTSLLKSLTDRKLLLDPIVAVRFQNFRVTVLGEVANPKVVMVPNEKISLLEALGFAGDMTIYAQRDRVLLIREEEGVKKVVRLNLNSGELFTSPYYYLRSNDIIYVEPNKAKVASTSRSSQWLPVVFSGLSLAAIVLDRVLR